MKNTAKSACKTARIPPAACPHFSLDGGLQDTALGLLRHRDDAASQEEVLYLACLLEALVSAPSAILRTDLIRRVYQEVNQRSQSLGFRWRGGEGHFIPR